MHCGWSAPQVLDLPAVSGLIEALLNVLSCKA
jgi:hypothetical protein